MFLKITVGIVSLSVSCYAAVQQPSLAQRIGHLQGTVRRLDGTSTWAIDTQHYKSQYYYPYMMTQVKHNEPIEKYHDPDCVAVSWLPDQSAVKPARALRALCQIDKAMAIAMCGVFANVSVVSFPTDPVTGQIYYEYAPEYYHLALDKKTRSCGKPYYSWPNRTLATTFQEVVPAGFTRDKGYRPLAPEYRERVYTQPPVLFAERALPVKPVDHLFAADLAYLKGGTIEQLIRQDLAQPWNLEDLISVLAYVSAPEHQDIFQVTDEDAENTKRALRNLIPTTEDRAHIKAVLDNLIRYERTIPEID